MTYEIWSNVWRSIPDVISAIKSVYLPGDQRYLSDTRSTLKYPSLLIRDPRVEVMGRESQTWHCEIGIFDIHEEGWSAEDTAMEEMYDILRTLIWLMGQPELLGFGYGVEATSFSIAQMDISVDNAIGWIAKFQMIDHDRMCDPDAGGVPNMPSVSLLGTYASDEDAIADGRSPGQWYLLSLDNVYGVTINNIPKKIDE